MGIRGFKRGVSMKVLSLAAAAVLAGVGARAASAAPLGTLQDLINDGAAGVTIGNYQFYGFQYQGIPTAGPNPAPTASQITVSLPDNVQTIGLQFSAVWQSVLGLNQESKINYYVHALNAEPLQFFAGVGVSFNGAVPIPGTSTFAQETDILTDTAGVPLANFTPITVFDDGTSASIDSSKSVSIAQGIRDIGIFKDITVSSSQDGGLSTISVSNNTFVTPVGQSPEPASLGLFAVAGVGLLRRRQRA
ncbi:MAG: hypothetical protein JWN51_3676 [Phycisphaerales bacterium]|nr:hypothetical protein [Phycisphaerales bacterium]